MKKITAIIIAALLLLPGAGATNILKDGEHLEYTLQLKMAWSWIDAGKATLDTRATVYNGRKAFRTSLIASGNRSADRLFVLRDTLETFITDDCTPLFFRKSCVEGKDTVNEKTYFTHENGKYKAKIIKTYADGHIREGGGESTTPIYDMISLVQHVRSMDNSSLKPGARITLKMAESRNVNAQDLRYAGVETIETGSGKAQCRVFTLVKNTTDKKGRARQETLLRFYTTTDAQQLPLRIDIFLKFAEARVVFDQ